MRTDGTNPASNQLPAGLNESSLLEAIESSGYPLQGLVAQTLTPDFGVTEEWGYIDRDTQEHRALDIFAFKELPGDSPAKPKLVLLIECKRSRHPYIFFKSVPDRPIPYFPKIAGLPYGKVSVYEAGTKRLTEIHGAHALGLETLEFVKPGPPRCAAFTKAVPKGSKVDLSGTEPFNSLVLPLTKAFDHATTLYKENGAPNWLTPTLVLCVSVVDAPMLMVDDPRRPTNPVLLPWVRIVRQEANPNDRNRSWDRSWYRYYSIDTVHADFFAEYISRHALPFAQTYAKRATEKAEVLLRGGEVDSLKEWDWQQVRPLPPKQ